MSDEIRITDPQTGGQKGQKKARFDLIPQRALWQVAELYGVGAAKYDERNWEKGYKWSLSIAALHRHMSLFQQGEDLDEETGQPHLASVVFHAFALMTFAETHPEKDDRPRRVDGIQQGRVRPDVRRLSSIRSWLRSVWEGH